MINIYMLEYYSKLFKLRLLFSLYSVKLEANGIVLFAWFLRIQWAVKVMLEKLAL